MLLARHRAVRDPAFEHYADKLVRSELYALREHLEFPLLRLLGAQVAARLLARLGRRTRLLRCAALWVWLGWALWRLAALLSPSVPTIAWWIPLLFSATLTLLARWSLRRLSIALTGFRRDPVAACGRALGRRFLRRHHRELPASALGDTRLAAGVFAVFGVTDQATQEVATSLADQFDGNVESLLRVASMLAA